MGLLPGAKPILKNKTNGSTEANPARLVLVSTKGFVLIPSSPGNSVPGSDAFSLAGKPWKHAIHSSECQFNWT